MLYSFAPLNRIVPCLPSQRHFPPLSHFRSKSLLVPYVLWNLILWGCALLQNPACSVSVFEVLGIGAVFDSSIVISPAGPVKPCFDAPAWYMRDMLPLTLLTPLFVRYKKYIPVALLFFMLLYHGNMRMKSEVMMAPSTICFYMFGIWLTCFKVEDGYRIFNPKFTPVVILAFLAACGGSLAYSLFHIGFRPQITMVGMLMGAMMIAHCGVAIERNFPNLSKRLAPLGAVSFLVFMCHWPIFRAVEHLFPALTHSLWVLLLPLPTYIVIVTAFLLMKHYTPWLMPYLAT